MNITKKEIKELIKQHNLDYVATCIFNFETPPAFYNLAGEKLTLAESLKNSKIGVIDYDTETKEYTFCRVDPSIEDLKHKAKVWHKSFKTHKSHAIIRKLRFKTYCRTKFINLLNFLKIKHNLKYLVN